MKVSASGGCYAAYCNLSTSFKSFQIPEAFSTPESVQVTSPGAFQLPKPTMIDDPTFKSLFRNILVKFIDDFPQEFADKNLCKNVARMERKTSSFIEKLTNPNKYKFTVSITA